MQRSEVLRRSRKSILSELSSLVKTAKRLQEGQRGVLGQAETVNDIVDEMILKAFRIVTKGVRFADVLEEDKRLRAPAAVTVMATVQEESVPPTPPADRPTFDDQTRDQNSDVESRATTDDTALSVATSDASDLHSAAPVLFSKRVSSLHSPQYIHGQRWSQHGNRLSSGISHRVSLAGPSPLSRANHLVSERLNKNHDIFLSHLGSFIGRLHLQSQSLPELSLATKQSALSGGQLLAVVDAVCAHHAANYEALAVCRSLVFDRISDLVYTARDTLTKTIAEDSDLIMPHDNAKLLTSATACVRAAGECVAKAKTAVERTGDFEFEGEDAPLDIDLTLLDVTNDQRSVSPMHPVAETSDTSSVTDSNRRSDSSTASQRRLTVVAVDKPLPEVPQQQDSPVTEEPPQPSSPTGPRPRSLTKDTVTSVASSTSSLRAALPPLPKLSTTIPPEGVSAHNEQSAAADHDFHSSSRYDSMVASSAGSSATYPSRDSEASMVSQASTRATTPDNTLVPRSQPSMSDLSAAASSTHTEEVDDVESRLMEKTFVHELMFNKEGQVTGGSLPALIERLTTHESTPDAMFVSTFYLTFRLFCTPTKLAACLIERFEYVAEAPHIAGPVRLRVYNAFKGWLESHWRDETDRDALDMINSFAETRLHTVLPSAARRLLDLTQRVAGMGHLVPRLVSSMGKTNTSISQYVPVDTPIPASVMSKSQNNMLAAFKTGTGNPTILDFEPIEIARQLTLKQMGIFCAILPEELLGSQWMKKGGAESPNVKAMSGFSTDLSNLVAETILHYPEIKKRAAVIKQWIKIAQQCLELNNYDGLMAIICSLNSSTICRLRKTWDAVSAKRKELLRTLQALVEPSQNHKALRTRLHDHVPPCLPFLGMYLTDLTFVDIGNPPTKQMSHGNDSEEEGTCGLTVVNFDKHSRTAKIIGELQRFQIPYRLNELPDMQDWITAQVRRVREGDQGNVQVSYYRKSLLLEPREMAKSSIPEPPPTPTIAPVAGSKTDLFGWMTRDRSNNNPAQV